MNPACQWRALALPQVPGLLLVKVSVTSHGSPGVANCQLILVHSQSQH